MTKFALQVLLALLILAACDRPSAPPPTPEPTATPYPTLSETNGQGIFAEIERLGSDSFNDYYQGAPLRITLTLDSFIPGTSVGLAIVKKPTFPPEFYLTRSFGGPETTQRVESADIHDGQIIAIENAKSDSSEGSHTYNCTIGKYGYGTLILRECSAAK